MERCRRAHDFDAKSRQDAGTTATEQPEAPPPPKHPIYGNGVAKGCFTSLCDKLFYFVRSQTIFSDLNFHTLLYQLTLGANFFDQECIDDYLLHG
jgi:hypothetical protein